VRFNRLGFSLLEAIVALAIFVTFGISVITILTQNSIRIHHSRMMDDMIELAGNTLQEALDEDYSPEESLTDWDYFMDKDGLRRNEDYLWRLVREVYEVPEYVEGSHSDDILRKKKLFVGPYMKIKIEVRRSSGGLVGDDDDVLVLMGIMHPPYPGTQPMVVDVKEPDS
jgi:hypothetical protein